MSPDNPHDYITRSEMQELRTDLKDHLRDLADAQTKVIDDRFQSFWQRVEERFKAYWWRNLLALGVAVGLLRFDLPAPVTAGAIAAAVGSALFKAVTVIIGGKSL